MSFSSGHLGTFSGRPPTRLAALEFCGGFVKVTSVSRLERKQHLMSEVHGTLLLHSDGPVSTDGVWASPGMECDIFPFQPMGTRANAARTAWATTKLDMKWLNFDRQAEISPSLK